MAKEQLVAKEILELVGGRDNIVSIEHCATRLRLILKDDSLLKKDEIENIEGVKGYFFASKQHQIILGTGFVNKVYGVLVDEGVDSGNVKSSAYDEMNLLQKIGRLFGDVFLPIIPVLVATGLFMGVRGLLVNLGVEMDANFLLFTEVLTDTAFAFLPALVAWSAMKRFGGTPVLGLVLGLMLVSPSLPSAWDVSAGADPLYFFGIIPVMGYQGSVLPALALGFVAAKIEKKLHAIVPDVLDLIVTPFLTLLASISIGLFIFGPLLHQVELWVLAGALFFMNMPFGVGGFFVGALNQVIVVTGMHHVLNGLEISLLAETGVNQWNAMMTGSLAAQGAAGIAVGLKLKNPKGRALAISSAFSAFLGITEPVIFGVNLRYMKPFLFALVGGGVAGMIAGISGVAATGMGITVIPGTLLYLDHLFIYLLINLSGAAVAFLLTYFFFDPNQEA